MSHAVAANVPASLVQGSQPIAAPLKVTNGNTLPRDGKNLGPTADAQTSAPAQASTATQIAHSTPKAATHPVNVPALIALLNKYLNDSGRPNQFRVDPTSRGQTIQEINPSNGEVVGEFAAAEFPALARGLGVSGVLVDSHA